jgi:excisionase family DNA binding protein
LAGVALGSCALKRLKRAMVGVWSGLDNRPVRPASSTATPELSAPQVLSAVVARTAGLVPDPAQLPESATRKGCAVAAQPSGKAATEYSSYLRTAEVADLLFVSPKTVSRWAKEGRLPFLKTLGGHRRYPEAEIRELANDLRQEATA